MKIVFFGSGAFGLPTLARLAGEHEVLAVVTQPDRPAGRRRQPTATPVGEWAAASTPTTPLFKPENVNEPECISAIRRFGADAWVVIAFGQKLSPPLLADRFAINLHASLLPRWRGAAPIHRAILAGDVVTGNSVITLADRMDAGLVLGASTRPIETITTSGDLHDALAADGPELMLSVLARHEAGDLRGEAQDEQAVTLARKLSREEAAMDWGLDAEACRTRINGYSPWPGVTVGIAGEAVKLLRADRGEIGGRGNPGALVDVEMGAVCCGDGRTVRLLEVQPAGKKAMPWEAFAAGRSLTTGDVLREDAL